MAQRHQPNTLSPVWWALPSLRLSPSFRYPSEVSRFHFWPPLRFLLPVPPSSAGCCRERFRCRPLPHIAAWPDFSASKSPLGLWVGLDREGGIEPPGFCMVAQYFMNPGGFNDIRFQRNEPHLSLCQPANLLPHNPYSFPDLLANLNISVGWKCGQRSFLHSTRSDRSYPHSTYIFRPCFSVQ